MGAEPSTKSASCRLRASVRLPPNLSLNLLTPSLLPLVNSLLRLLGMAAKVSCWTLCTPAGNKEISVVCLCHLASNDG